MNVEKLQDRIFKYLQKRKHQQNLNPGNEYILYGNFQKILSRTLKQHKIGNTASKFLIRYDPDTDSFKFSTGNLDDIVIDHEVLHSEIKNPDKDIIFNLSLQYSTEIICTLVYAVQYVKHYHSGSTIFVIKNVHEYFEGAGSY